LGSLLAIQASACASPVLGSFISVVAGRAALRLQSMRLDRLDRSSKVARSNLRRLPPVVDELLRIHLLQIGLLLMMIGMLWLLIHRLLLLLLLLLLLRVRRVREGAPCVSAAAAIAASTLGALLLVLVRQPFG
jgi:hypothetical protein